MPIIDTGSTHHHSQAVPDIGTSHGPDMSGHFSGNEHGYHADVGVTFHPSPHTSVGVSVGNTGTWTGSFNDPSVGVSFGMTW